MLASRFSRASITTHIRPLVQFNPRKLQPEHELDREAGRAKTIGIELPTAILLRADEVIE
jgi:hypothetical protein